MGRQIKLSALQVPSRLRGPAFGGITFRPARYVARRCCICWAGEGAAYAGKSISGWPVFLIDVAALRAFPAGVARVDTDQRNATQRRLIGHEIPELSESPTVMRSPLALPNRCPVANVRQVFHPDAASGAFSLAHDRFANAVVQVAGEPRFFESAATQQPFSRFGPFFLEFPSQSCMAAAQIGVQRSTEYVAIAVSSDVPLTEINAEVIGRITFWGIAYVDCNVQEEHTIAVYQIRLPTCTPQLRTLVCAAHPWHQLPAAIGQYGDPIRALPRQNALVVDNGAMRPERRLDVSISLVRLDNFVDRQKGHLGAKIEATTGFVIRQLLKFDFIRAPVGEGGGRKGIACRVETFHRSKHGIRLLGIWQ